MDPALPLSKSHVVPYKTGGLMYLVSKTPFRTNVPYIYGKLQKNLKLFLNIMGMEQMRTRLKRWRRVNV